MLCLKNAPKMRNFRLSIFVPTLTRKKEGYQKTKTNVRSYNVSSIQNHFIWFSSFSTSGAFDWKPKPIRTHQRTITRDRFLDFFLFKRSTRSIGARTKVMGRKIFKRALINYCFHKQKVTVFSSHNMYVDEFRGDPLFKTARKYINKRNG